MSYLSNQYSNETNINRLNHIQTTLRPFFKFLPDDLQDKLNFLFPYIQQKLVNDSMETHLINSKIRNKSKYIINPKLSPEEHLLTLINPKLYLFIPSFLTLHIENSTIVSRNVDIFKSDPSPTSYINSAFINSLFTYAVHSTLYNLLETFKKILLSSHNIKYNDIVYKYLNSVLLFTCDNFVKSLVHINGLAVLLDTKESKDIASKIMLKTIYNPSSSLHYLLTENMTDSFSGSYAKHVETLKDELLGLKL